VSAVRLGWSHDSGKAGGCQWENQKKWRLRAVLNSGNSMQDFRKTSYYRQSAQNINGK
jgi:hypothetical protein